MRVVSQQFDALFTDGLYWEIGRHAIRLAMRLKKMFTDRGYPLFIDSPTNQQFFILSDEQIARLQKDVAFSLWERVDESHMAVRFCTSWSTTDEQLDALEKLL